MKLQIHCADNLSASRREGLERLVRLGFTRFSSEIRHVAVSIGDQNGPRGGVDQRCIVRVSMRGLPEVIVEETHETVEQAVGTAVGRASRSVSRALERRRRHREYVYRRFESAFEREESA